MHKIILQILLTNNRKYVIIVTNVTLGSGVLENHIKFLSNTFLFRTLPKSTSFALIDGLDYTTAFFQKDEVVYSPEGYKRMLGFVVSGGCSVYKYHSSEHDLLMNTLKPGDSFGVLAVFSSEDEYPTVIKATKKTEILFIDAAECKELVSKNSDIAMSVISFLAGKVAFLNTKISTLSGKNITEKLAIYLLCEAYKSNADAIPFNIQKASSALSVSRQTVYRGIEALEAENLIKYDVKKIIILDQYGLERLTK